MRMRIRSKNKMKKDNEYEKKIQITQLFQF